VHYVIITISFQRSLKTTKKYPKFTQQVFFSSQKSFQLQIVQSYKLNVKDSFKISIKIMKIYESKYSTKHIAKFACHTLLQHVFVFIIYDKY